MKNIYAVISILDYVWSGYAKKHNLSGVKFYQGADNLSISEDKSLMLFSNNLKVLLKLKALTDSEYCVGKLC